MDEQHNLIQDLIDIQIKYHTERMAIIERNYRQTKITLGILFVLILFVPLITWILDK